MHKLDTNKGSFLHALQIASKAINPKPIIPLYNCIMLEVDGKNVVMTSTNFEISIRVTVENSSGGKFKTAVPAKLTTDFVNMLLDDKIAITFNEQNQSMSVVTNHSKNNIKCVDATDYEPSPRIEKALFKMNSGDLKRAVTRTSFCSSTDVNKPALTGIHMLIQDGGIVFSAVDGFRLSREVVPIPKKYTKKKMEAIIKASTLDIISRILDDEGEVAVEIRDTNVIFNSKNVCVSVQRLDGKFPDIDKLFDSIKENTTVTIPTLQFLRFCKQVELFTGDNNAVKLSISRSSLQMSAISDDKGDSTVKLEAKTSGKGLDIGINIQMLKQFLEICDTEEAVIKFMSAEHPILLTMKDNENYKHVIMPVAL